MRFSVLILSFFIACPTAHAMRSRKNTAAATGVCIGVVGIAVITLYAYEYLKNKKRAGEIYNNSLIGAMLFKEYIYQAQKLLEANFTMPDDTTNYPEDVMLFVRKKLKPDDTELYVYFSRFYENLRKIRHELLYYRKEFAHNYRYTVLKMIAVHNKLKEYCKQNNFEEWAETLPIEGELLRRQFYLCYLTFLKKQRKT